MVLCCQSSDAASSVAGDFNVPGFCNNSQSTDDLGVESMCDDLDFDFNFEDAAAASTSSAVTCHLPHHAYSFR